MARRKLIEDEKKEQRAVLANGYHALSTGSCSAYRPEFAELGRIFCLAFGATDEELAVAFAVDQSTIGEWKLRYPEFRESCKEGKAIANARVVERLYHSAVGYDLPSVETHRDADGKVVKVIETTKHFPPNPTSLTFFLKNRMPEAFRDRIDPLVNVNNFSGIKIDALSDSQLDALLLRLQKEL